MLGEAGGLGFLRETLCWRQGRHRQEEAELDMAAAAATPVDAPSGTGSRRAVVRSERFMEWQRELSSSRATYGGRKRQDDNEVMEGGGGGMRMFCGGKRHSSDEDNVKMPRHEGSEEREGEGEEPTADSHGGGGGGGNGGGGGGGDAGAAANQRVRGKKQQHQRQRSDAKKHRKDNNEGDQKQQQRNALTTIKDSATPAAEGEGGRMRKCKQQQAPQVSPARRQQAPQAPTQQQLPQPLARRRQRRLPRSFTPPKEEIERGLRSLTRNRGSEAVQATATAMPINSNKGATKRSKRVAQRLANEEPAPPPLKLPKLHIVLTRKEIQEDWMKITGHKYSGKPKKSTLIQRGLGLCTSLTCPSSIRYLNEPQCVFV